MARFRATSANDPTPCIEIFRHAIYRRAPDAWEALIAIYRPYVERRILSLVTVDPQTLEDLTQQTIMRFWRAYTPDRLARAHSLAEILRYWQDCATTASRDWMRRNRRKPPPDTSDDLPEDALVSRASVPADSEQAAANRRLWELVRSTCHDELDLYIAHRMFVEGQKPRDLFLERAADFGSKENVYQRVRNLKDRLRRMPEIRELLAEWA